MNIQRYPLHWPIGWARTPAGARARATFGKTSTTFAPPTAEGVRARRETRRALTPSDAALRLDREIDRLGGVDAILSTNLRLRLDGVPRGDQGDPSDPGAAVYFTLNKSANCLACDRWVRVADNIAALAAHIDALRRIERYGVGTLEQAFRGYLALPPMTTGVEWWRVLGVEPAATLDDVEAAFRAKARELHPDRAGGDHDLMARLSEARELARRALRIQ
jgi:hypothetical protein